MKNKHPKAPLGTAAAWPALVVIVIFFVLPQGLLLVSPPELAGQPSPVLNFDVFARLIDPLYIRVFWRSLLLAAGTTLLTLIVGFPVAWALVRAVPPRHRNAALFLVTLPLWTSVLVKIYAWMFILRTGGLLDRLLAAVGIPGLSLLYTDAAVALGQLYIELPFMVLPIYAVLERMDERILEAARDLGAREWTVFRRVVVPLAMPGIVSGCVLVFVPSLGSVLAPDLLGGAKSAWLGTLITGQFGAARDPAFGSALSFSLSVLTLVTFAATRRFLRAAHQ